MKHQIKWRFLVVICFAMLLAGLASALSESELGYTPLSELIPKGATSVIFRDEAISAGMAKNHGQLQNSDGSYSLADLAKMESFSLARGSSVDLSEIQLFPQLKHLTVDGASKMTGVRALLQCPQLESLALWYVDEMDMAEVVKATPEIIGVFFMHCGELEYAAIAGWEKLARVGFSGSAITDLSYLTKIPKLEALTFLDVPHADFASCLNLANLNFLWVHENPTLQNPLLWQMIAQSPSLKRLKLGSGYIDEKYDLNRIVFPRLETLTVLEINRAAIRDFDFFQKCPNLTLLAFQNCAFVSQELEGLRGLKKLKELVLENVGLTDVSFVMGMDLSLLWLTDNCITDISPLTGAEQIKKLSLHGNPVKDWTPLAQINGLEKLFDNSSEELPVPENVEIEDVFGWWALETSLNDDMIPQE